MASLKDVADEASVSIGTASLVLNNRTSNVRISEETRTRVLEAARRLNYHPNPFARSLASRRANTVGIVVYDLSYVTNVFLPFAQILLSCYRVIQSFGYHCMIATTQDPPESSSSSDIYISTPVYSRQVDGMVIWDSFINEEAVLKLREDGIPMVLIERRIPGIPAMLCDNTQGARQAARHLLDLGHRRIADLYGGQPHIRRDWEIRTGLSAAMRERGLEFMPEYDRPGFRLGGTEFDQIVQRLDDLLSLPEPPTAILCGSDRTAYHVLGDLRRRGIAVPDEMSVIGFDGIPLAEFTDPPLSTVAVPYAELASRAVTVLMDAMRGKKRIPAEVTLPAQLVVRGTCGLPRC